MKDYTDNAPWFRNQIKTVIIENGVTSIGRYAFTYCSSLTSITIPDSVTFIDSGAFSGCSSLTSITIPDSVTSIEDGAFAYCRSLTSITIPDSVIIISYSAFRGCRSLTSITIPDSVTFIGEWAFEDCRSLTSIAIPDSVTSIDIGAFEYCRSLTSITIPDSVTSIGGSAFYECSSLMSITIPDSVTFIGDDAFDRCENLIDICYGWDESNWRAIRAGYINDRTTDDGHFQILDVNRDVDHLAKVHFTDKWDPAFFERTSTKYNNALARAAAEMSDKAEIGKDAIRDLYHTYDFYACEYTDLPSNDNPIKNHLTSAAFAIGQTTIPVNGVDTTILIVTARGTKNLWEGIGDVAKGPWRGKEKNFLGKRVWQHAYD